MDPISAFAKNPGALDHFIKDYFTVTAAVKFTTGDRYV